MSSFAYLVTENSSIDDPLLKTYVVKIRTGGFWGEIVTVHLDYAFGTEPRRRKADYTNASGGAEGEMPTHHRMRNYAEAMSFGAWLAERWVEYGKAPKVSTPDEAKAFWKS